MKPAISTPVHPPKEGPSRRIGLELAELEFVAQDGLSGVSWRFYFLRDRLVVDRYLEWASASKRHKKIVVQNWERIDGRNSTMRKEDVPFSHAITLQAKDAWLRRLRDEVFVGFQER